MACLLLFSLLSLRTLMLVGLLLLVVLGICSVHMNDVGSLCVGCMLLGRRMLLVHNYLNGLGIGVAGLHALIELRHQLGRPGCYQWIHDRHLLGLLGRRRVLLARTGRRRLRCTRMICLMRLAGRGCRWRRRCCQILNGLLSGRIIGDAHHLCCIGRRLEMLRRRHLLIHKLDTRCWGEQWWTRGGGNLNLCRRCLYTNCNRRAGQKRERL